MVKSFWDGATGYFTDYKNNWYAGFLAGPRLISDVLGYTQFSNARKSYKAQIDYEQYLRGANERAFKGWQRTYGRKGLSIKYPEFSYPGQIKRSDTAIARNMFDYSSAGANFGGNILYRGAGLYGVAGRLSRSL